MPMIGVNAGGCQIAREITGRQHSRAIVVVGNGVVVHAPRVVVVVGKHGRGGTLLLLLQSRVVHVRHARRTRVVIRTTGRHRRRRSQIKVLRKSRQEGRQGLVVEGRGDLFVVGGGALPRIQIHVIRQVQDQHVLFLLWLISFWWMTPPG